MALADVTASSFPDEVLMSPQLVVVDYWADWCAPCKQLNPILDELAGAYAGQVKFVKVDTTAEPGLASEQGILALPTLQFFKGGRLVHSVSGGKSKNALRKMLEEHL